MNPWTLLGGFLLGGLSAYWLFRKAYMEPMDALYAEQARILGETGAALDVCIAELNAREEKRESIPGDEWKIE